MARKSESSENNGESSNGGAPEVKETTETEAVKTPESTDDSPVVIEAEAVDVTTVSADDVLADDRKDDSKEVSEPESSVIDAAEEVGAGADDAEPVSAPLPTPQPQIARTGLSFLALVFGGLVAGGLGYFVATQFPPETEMVDTSAMSESISENSARLAELSTRIENLPSSSEVVDLSGLEESFAELSGKLDRASADFSSAQDGILGSVAELQAQSAALEQRLAALENANTLKVDQATSDDLEAFRAEVARLTADAEARLAEAQQKAIEAEQSAAEARAQADAEIERAATEAARQAALIDLRSAVENGAAYAELLSSIDDVPEELAAHADGGVATLGDLKQGFPAAARLALAASETMPQETSAGERFAAFLKRQTNARSLTPREGDSADAVLSRAEAHLGNGDLSAALAELDALPEEGKSAMSSWLDLAAARKAALDALRSLSATN